MLIYSYHIKPHRPFKFFSTWFAGANIKFNFQIHTSKRLIFFFPVDLFKDELIKWVSFMKAKLYCSFYTFFATFC